MLNQNQNLFLIIFKSKLRKCLKWIWKETESDACAARDGPICSKNREIVPYHRDSPNTRIGTPLWSPFPIMAPGTDTQLQHLFFDSTEELSLKGYIQWITGLERRAFRKSVCDLVFFLIMGAHKTIAHRNLLRSAWRAGKQQQYNAATG